MLRNHIANWQLHLESLYIERSDLEQICRVSALRSFLRCVSSCLHWREIFFVCLIWGLRLFVIALAMDLTFETLQPRRLICILSFELTLFRYSGGDFWDIDDTTLICWCCSVTPIFSSPGVTFDKDWTVRLGLHLLHEEYGASMLGVHSRCFLVWHLNVDLFWCSWTRLRCIVPRY